MRHRYVWLSLSVSSLFFNACYDTSGDNDGDEGDGGELGGGTAGKGGGGGKGGSSSGKGGTSGGGTGGTITPGAGGSTGGAAGNANVGGTSGSGGSGPAGASGGPAGTGGGDSGGAPPGTGGTAGGGDGGAPPDPEGGSPATGGAGDAGGAPNPEGGASGMGGTAGTGGPGNASCATYASKLASCGLFDGEVLGDCWDYDPRIVCTAACAEAASCADLQSVFCEAGENTFSTCSEACAVDIESFECDDGSVVTIGRLCDDYADCSNGEDEVGCFVSCDNGEQIRAEWVCDLGEPDCTDGSDEARCGELVCGEPPTPEP